MRNNIVSVLFGEDYVRCWRSLADATCGHYAPVVSLPTGRC